MVKHSGVVRYCQDILWFLHSQLVFELSEFRFARFCQFLDVCMPSLMEVVSRVCSDIGNLFKQCTHMFLVFRRILLPIDGTNYCFMIVIEH